MSDEEVHLVTQGETTEAITQQKAEDVEGARPLYSTTFYVGLGIEARQHAWISKY